MTVIDVSYAVMIGLDDGKLSGKIVVYGLSGKIVQYPGGRYRRDFQMTVLEILRPRAGEFE